MEETTMKQKVTNQTRRKMLIGGAAAASTPLWLNVANAQAETIKIGFPTPLTGPFSAEAQDQVKAAELAIKEFNDAGGFNGRKAELLVRDDKLNPGEAATRTLELIEKDKVNYVVGSLSAATQLSINAVCKERKVLFNSISQSDAINEVKDWSVYTFHEALNPTNKPATTAPTGEPMPPTTVTTNDSAKMGIPISGLTERVGEARMPDRPAIAQPRPNTKSHTLAISTPSTLTIS
jgi:hypothetical protein